MRGGLEAKLETLLPLDLDLARISTTKKRKQPAHHQPTNDTNTNRITKVHAMQYAGMSEEAIKALVGQRQPVHLCEWGRDGTDPGGH